MNRETAIESFKGFVSTKHATVIPVSGHSMWPTLRDGDQITIGRYDCCHRGDILLFDDGARLIVHRLISNDDGKVVTKGDNRRVVDPSISAENILGRVTKIERGDKTIHINHRRQRLLRHLFAYAWVLAALRRRLPTL